MDLFNKTKDKIVGGSDSATSSRLSVFHVKADPDPGQNVSRDDHVIPPEPEASSLALSHLQKLFNDYQRNLSQSGVGEQEGKLYEMLPLFCKVFTSLPPGSMLERMDGILQFAGNVAKLVVKEIRRRASYCPAESASHSIWTFLQSRQEAVETVATDTAGDGVRQNGWNLLCTLYLLASTTTLGESQAILDILASTGVPSTLVRCLSLFLELPPMDQEEASIDSSTVPTGSALNLSGDRSGFETKFFQLTAKISSHPMACHELMQKNDLILLFLTLTNPCPPRNGVWKRMAGDILTALARSSMNNALINYLHGNQCIELCLINLNRAILPTDCSPHQVVDTLVTFFCFLKDSCTVSQQLLEDFRLYNGYDFIIDFVLKIETKADTDSESREAIRNILLLLSSLCVCGHKELNPSQKLNESLFTLPNFVMPQPYGNGISVRNLHAFAVFQTLFAKTNNNLVGENILDAVRNILHSDNANYFILEPLNPLAQFCEQLPHKTPIIQDKYFDILDFVVHQLNYVPCKELISLSILVKTTDSVPFITKCLEVLLKILRYDLLYKDVYREVGLLEIISSCLAKYSDTFVALGADDNDGEKVPPVVTTPYNHLYLLIMDLLNLLINSNNANATLFRQCRGYKTIYEHLGWAFLRPQGLIVIQQLLLLPGGDEDMKILLECLVNNQYASDVELKIHVLKTLIYVLRESHRARATFRKVGGFVSVFSLLVSMENAFGPTGPAKMTANSYWIGVSDKDKYRLLKSIFSSFTVAMRYEPANSKYFSSEVKYENLAETIRCLGPFDVERTKIEKGTGAEPDKVSLGTELTAFFEKIFTRTLTSASHQATEEASLLKVPIELVRICHILRYLYDMTLDSYERAIIPNKSLVFSSNRSPSPTSPLIAPTTKNFSTGALEEEDEEEGTVEYDSRSSSVSSTPLPALTNDSTQRPRASGIKEAPGTKKFTRQLTSMHIPLSFNAADIMVVHPGALISFLNLIPSVPMATDKVSATLSLQTYLIEIVKSLVRTERNQQVMCQAGMVRVILNNFGPALVETGHTLHAPCQYIFERLASQAISPENLRYFLQFQNIGNLLDAKPSNALANEDVGQLALTRVKCLVSMITPRDGTLIGSVPLDSGRHLEWYYTNNMAAAAPPFVEFDMSTEGFACLYVPTLAPQARNSNVTLGGVTIATGAALVGGIGTGERAFPPQSGVTLSTWFCVEKFSDKHSDPHPVRLLTVVRCSSSGATSDDGKPSSDTARYVCLTVLIRPRDRSLWISTRELPFTTTFTGGGDGEDIGDSPDHSSVHVPDINRYLVEGCWNHLGLVFNRSVLKNSTINVYLNGYALAAQKINYISQTPGGCTSLAALSTATVYAYIGTPPAMRRFSKLVWKQGPFHVLEESLNQAQIGAIFGLGPAYIGNYTETRRVNYEHASRDTLSTAAKDGTRTDDICLPIVAEDKVLIGIHPSSISIMTLAKIRKLFNKTDAKSIALQMNVSTHDNETPIKLLHNICGHLLGPARSMGAIFIGYLGIRIFVPKPIASTIFSVGGIPILLGLLAISNTSEGFYAALKSLVGIAKYNGRAIWEMKKLQGYQILALFFKMKNDIINNHLLYLTFTLVGTVDSNRLTSVIPNLTAFEDLLIDFELWNDFSDDLKKFLFEHILELICDSVERGNNLTILRNLSFVQKVIFLLYHNVTARDSPDPRVQGTSFPDKSYVDLILKILAIMLKEEASPANLLTFGQFMITLLPEPRIDENLCFPGHSSFEVGPPSGSRDDSRDEGHKSLLALRDKIALRNACLELLLSISHNPMGKRDITFNSQIEAVLGFDWLLNFMLSNVHTTTYLRSLRLILTMVGQSETAFNDFIDNVSTSFGNWLENSQSVLNQSLAILLGYNLTAKNISSAADTREVKVSLLNDLNVPAITLLAALIGKHPVLPETFLLLFSWMLNQPIRELPPNINRLDLDIICRYVFGVAPNKMASSLLRSTATGDIRGACRINEHVVYLVLNLLQCGHLGPVATSQYGQDSVEPQLVAKDYEVSVPLTGSQSLCQLPGPTELVANQPACVALNFLVFLYHTFDEFQSLCFEETFLGHLISVLLEGPTLTKDFQRDITICLLPNHQDYNKESSTDVNSETDQIVMINRATDSSSPMTKPYITEDGESLFSGSPLKRAIRDFLKCILVDSFDNYQTPKTNVLDIVLENLPDVCPRSLQCQFQTEILSMTTDHILAMDNVLGGSTPMNGSQGTAGLQGGVNLHKQTNAVYFASRMVDKVWQGMYLKSSIPVFNFIVKLLTEAKRKNWSINIDSLYTSLDRLILYLLSQDIETERGEILDCLRKMVTYRNHIFATNSCPELSDFIGSLCYCLLRLTAHLKIEKESHRTTKWHIEHLNPSSFSPPPNNNDGLSPISNLTQPLGDNYLNDMTVACQKVWEEMYLYKKMVIEEIFKFPTLSSSHSFTYPILENFRPLIYDASKRFWISFVENERKNMSSTSFFSNSTNPKVAGDGGPAPFTYHSHRGTDFQQKLETGLQKIGSGFGKITKTKTKRTFSFRIEDDVLFKKIVEQMRTHISIVSDLVNLQYDHFYQSQVMMKRQYAVEEWKRLEGELLRERSIWGPADPDPLDKWMLDPTEGPCRMRKRLIKNTDFYNHYPYRVKRGKVFIGPKDKKPLRYKPPTSFDSQIYHRNKRKGFRIPTLLKGITPPSFDYPMDLDEAAGVTEVNTTDFLPTTRTDGGPLKDGSVGADIGAQTTEVSVINYDSHTDPTPTEKSGIEEEGFSPQPQTSSVGAIHDPGTDLERDFRRLSMRIRRSFNNTPNKAVKSLDLCRIPVAEESSIPTSITQDLSPDLTKDLTDENMSDKEQALVDNDAVKTVGKNIEMASVEINQTPKTLVNDPPIINESNGNKEGVSKLQAPPQPQTSQTESSSDPDNQALLRLLGEKEPIKSMFRCARVQGLDTFEGLLLFGNDNYYIVDGFTLLKSREIRDIRTLPIHFHDPVIPFSPMNHDSKKECHKFSYRDIKDVLKRRYLLQPIGLEIFSEDGRNYLLVFPKATRDKVFKRFLTLAKGITDNVKDSVSGQKRNVNVEPSSFSTTTGGILNNLIGEKSVTDRWVKGEINNFQYLMHLNTLAGRSYNDLMQYPIFPWILSDYTSHNLDLNDPGVYRDLSKPMGAQTPDRLFQFKKRYIEWDDPHGDTPPYHYGTCYSSAMIVASYLVRMEPFAQHFLRLQGGHFDLADRMFHSVGASWYSSSKHNMADVKELIPEFFYLPDFLRNSNRFDLGTKQNGVTLGDVVLPPWAKDDAREFIRLHRAALESAHVSANLHHWIDLIFGCKQTGDSAVNAVNVFHHLFYEGSSDVFLIDDPTEKNAIVGFINNFGQIPCQLFKKPHPTKRVPAPSLNMSAHNNHFYATSPPSFIHNLDLLTPTQRPIKSLRGAVGQIVSLTDQAPPSSSTASGQGHHSSFGGHSKLPSSIRAVEQNKALLNLSLLLSSSSSSSPPSSTSNSSSLISATSNNTSGANAPNSFSCVSWGYPDSSIRIGLLPSEEGNNFAGFSSYNGGDGQPTATAVIATGAPEILCAVVVAQAGSPRPLLVTGGPDSVVWVHDLTTVGERFWPKPKVALYGHTSTVTCLAVSSPYKMLVSGSRDTTCIIWDLNRLCFVRQLRPLHPAPVAAIHINELSGDFITCAASWIYLWDINGYPITHIDSSIASPLQPIESLGSSSTLTTSLPLQRGLPSSRHPSASSHSIESSHVDSPRPNQFLQPLQILCLAMSQSNDWDKANVILTGSNDGIVRIYSLEFTQYRITSDTLINEATELNTDQHKLSPKSTVHEENQVIQIVPSQEAIDHLQSKTTTTNADNQKESEIVTEQAGDGCLKEEEFFESFSQNDIDMAKLKHNEIVNRSRAREDQTNLKEGHKWLPHLSLRHKLALPPNDNSAITALAISNDQRAIYAGDNRGRIFVWTLSDNPNHWVVDHWLKDDMVSTCPGCSVTFHFTERKHHCRNCGKVFCSRCSKYESEISRLKILKPVRVCRECHDSMKNLKA